MRRTIVRAAALLLLCNSLEAQQREVITVTATKLPEEITMVPIAITVISGDYLRLRNATDLPGALAAVGGIAIAPGGDAGPAGSVPEMWGLREFDAFLLVVDGVPWGGAFNPDLPSLDMNNVDRIEVVRGSAPVMYGATSFVGVIHVIHRPPGGEREARVSAGSFRTGALSVTVPISQTTMLAQSITASLEQRGFRDRDTSYRRGNVLYRASRGAVSVDAGVVALRQDPASPHLREGRVLSLRTPRDANYNPSDRRIDHNRVFGTLRWEGPAAVTLSVARSSVKTNRGFLSGITGASVGVSGYAQDRDVDDIYFDAHIVRSRGPALRVIAGIDHLFGHAVAESRTFTYSMPLSGRDAPSTGATGASPIDFRETRNFSGLYAVTEWTAAPNLRVDIGARLNHTRQQRSVRDAHDTQTSTRLSGSLGATYMIFRGVAAFANYRNTFKPAATDFGPNPAPAILRAENAQSFELGVKGSTAQSRFRWQVAGFDLDFSNLVVATARNGLPALENGGKTRFRGVDADVDYRLTSALHAALGYSYHDARFGDFMQAFDGVPTQLRGKRFEMSPFNLTGATLTFESGRIVAHAGANYAGARFLNKRNTALAAPYTTWSAGAGYRFGRGELRVDGRNLNNVRPPVAESELGDAQYYLLPARSVEVTYKFGF